MKLVGVKSFCRFFEKSGEKTFKRKVFAYIAG